ncbi:proline dehydrogenase [Novosphingobium pentaromativorans US6-1]|uniref:Proline dehydrogenase n=2 Tax=Novosphingobium pentaromativorans TaxID=205844 RepID=G6EEA6_9SPHN|nr:proline dehydrogenase [Novosphingobium pentaromativorans US6-1]EHJ60328.1 proline dehydrogenase [Novosphingobium pentaromativorans US6-1]
MYLRGTMREALKSILGPVLKRATSKYVAGETLEDAAELALRAGQQNLRCTLCYWNDGTEDPEIVVREYSRILSLVGEGRINGALAAKLPALKEREDLVEQVVAQAREVGAPVIFDAHAPPQTDDTLKALERYPREGVGLAIPGRWKRSLRDADRAIELGVRVRVVKGEWIDPDHPGIDLREGYLGIIRRLAGKAAFVGVATHDAPLAREAMRILAEAGTPFEQEFVYPLPIEAALREGAPYGAGARLYIPYGEAWLPYSLKRAIKSPKTLYWLGRDLIGGRNFVLPSLDPAQMPAAPVAN